MILPPLTRLVLFLAASSRLVVGADLIVVSVDAVNGNDSLCYSLQELQAAGKPRPPDTPENATDTRLLIPCRTINRALGNVDCYNSCRYQEFNSEALRNVIVRLFDGIHRLSDCVAIDGGQNVTVETVNPGKVSVHCAYFPDNVMERRDGIRSCQTEGLTFRGIRFENCGHYSPTVFLNRTSQNVFEDCVFA